MMELLDNLAAALSRLDSVLKNGGLGSLKAIVLDDPRQLERLKTRIDDRLVADDAPVERWSKIRGVEIRADYPV